MKLPSLNFLSFESRSTNSLSLPLFTIFIALHPLAAFAVIAYFFPETWAQQKSAGATNIILLMIGCNLVYCFGEYLFHRYLLHANTVSLLTKLSFSHLAHHKLTSIRFTDDKVKSEYPIVDLEHDSYATFPPYALLAFMAFFTVFFAPMAFSFPRFPILISGYIAIAIAHYLYETIHVAHHTPYDPWWKRKIEGPMFGTMWRKLYGFHQAHHANYKCNMNIGGFYGLPLADLVLGTYEQPAVLLLDGAHATKALAASLAAKPPRWPISAFDSANLKRRRRMSKEHSERVARRAAAAAAAAQPEVRSSPARAVVDPAGPAELR